MMFSGIIGFYEGDVEVSSDVWRPNIVERPYVGYITKNYRRYNEESDKQNRDLVVNNNISVLADLYLQTHFSTIAYVIWNGQKLSASATDVNYPRISIEIGGVYSGPENATGTQ